MRGLSRAHEQHIRDLLESCELPRDALPYTEEFEDLKERFWERSFKKLEDSEFWQLIANVGKRGGIRGKRAIRAPYLTDEQKQVLRRLVPLPLGKRDGLPYTDKFHKLVDRFNALTGLGLDRRQVWLAVLSLAK